MTPDRLTQLEARISALETEKPEDSSPSTEGLRERLQRERQERIEESRESRPVNDERRMGDPRPTSRQRKEDLSRRSSTNLAGPTMNPPRPPSPQVPRGNTIAVVVVDNGEFKTGSFLIKGGLSAIP